MAGQFDKFMDDLEKRQKEQEDKKKELKEAEDNWQARALREKYQERPGNRTTWGK